MIVQQDHELLPWALGTAGKWRREGADMSELEKLFITEETRSSYMQPTLHRKLSAKDLFQLGMKVQSTQIALTSGAVAAQSNGVVAGFTADGQFVKVKINGKKAACSYSVNFWVPRFKTSARSKKLVKP